MAQTYNGTLTGIQSIQVSEKAPLDVRTVVDYLSDLTTKWDGIEGDPGIQNLYTGIVVYVKETQEIYVLTSTPKNSDKPESWKKIGGGDTEGLASEEWVESQGYLKAADLPDFLTASDVEDYVKVEDLEGYLTAEDIADLASKSDLDGYVKTEDALEYLTSSDLGDYATKSYVDKKIEDLVGGAPETLDTLKEIAEALEDNATMAQVAEAISTKANAADVYTKDQVDAKVAEVDAKVDAIPEEGSFPEIGGSEAEFTPGLATVEGVIDYVADAITEATPDLSDYAKKEDLPVVPTKVSELENDVPYLTEHQDLSDYAKKEELPVEGTFPEIGGSEAEYTPGVATVEGVIDYVADAITEAAPDLTPYATKDEIPTKVSELENDVPYLTEHQDLSDYAKYVDLIDFLTGSDLDDYVKTEVLDGYLTPEDIADLASKSDLDGYVRVDDAVEFLTASDLDIYATKSYVDNKIAELPDEGTFPEIGGSEAEFTPGLATVEGVIDYVADAISEAAPDLTPYATKEEIPTKVSELENDVPYLTEHQDLSAYAEKDYVDVAIASVPELSEVVTTDGTQPTSGSGLSVSNDSENAFIEEVYVDDYLHADVYYTSKGINSSKDNGGSELEDASSITLSNGGSSWIKLTHSGVMRINIEDDSLGFTAENIVGLIANDHEYINPYEGHAYPGSQLSFSLGSGDMIKFNVDIDFTGFTETRDDDPTEYVFGQTGSNYEDLDIYSVNVLPTVNAYVDGVSTRVLTEGDKLEINNKIDNNAVRPISSQEIMDLF